MGLRIVLLACIIPFICPFFIQFSLIFVFRLFRLCVTVFFATYLLLLLYSSALLKQCSGAIVRFSDSSSLIKLLCLVLPFYCSYKMEFSLPKQSQTSRSIL